MSLRSINPATLEVLSEIPELTVPQLEKKLARAQKTSMVWKNTTFASRAQRMKKVAKELRIHKTSLAQLISQEVGKTVAAALGEVEKCALVCEFYAQHARSFLAPEKIVTDAKESYVRFDPLGIVQIGRASCRERV